VAAVVVAGMLAQRLADVVGRENSVDRRAWTKALSTQYGKRVNSFMLRLH